MSQTEKMASTTYILQNSKNLPIPIQFTAVYMWNEHKRKKHTDNFYKFSQIMITCSDLSNKTTSINDPSQNIKTQNATLIPKIDQSILLYCYALHTVLVSRIIKTYCYYHSVQAFLVFSLRLFFVCNDWWTQKNEGELDLDLDLKFCKNVAQYIKGAVCEISS